MDRTFPKPEMSFQPTSMDPSPMFDTALLDRPLSGPLPGVSEIRQWVTFSPLYPGRSFPAPHLLHLMAPLVTLTLSTKMSTDPVNSHPLTTRPTLPPD